MERFHQLFLGFFLQLDQSFQELFGAIAKGEISEEQIEKIDFLVENGRCGVWTCVVILEQAFLFFAEITKEKIIDAQKRAETAEREVRELERKLSEKEELIIQLVRKIPNAP